MIADLADFYAYSGFATSVTFTTVAGVSTTGVPVLIKYGQNDSYQGADYYAVDATVRVQAQGTSGIVTIAAGDRFTIGTGNWVVIDAKKAASGYEWICSISKKR
jgi:hypothetical protein